jgi:hypothetical protein
VYVALEINGTPLWVDGLALAVEFHDVSAGDKARGHAARQQKVLWVFVVSYADMTKTIDYALVVKDVISHDEIVDQGLIGGQRLGLNVTDGHKRSNCWEMSYSQRYYYRLSTNIENIRMAALLLG